jgi:hypothetical protein
MLPRALTAALLAAITSLASLAIAAPSFAADELPRLTGNPAAGVVPDWFDDHSVSSDDHLSWSPQSGEIYTNNDLESSQREPKDVEWQSSINVSGPGGLELCGYPSGTVGWMRAYQLKGVTSASVACPAGEPTSGQFGWFRYVYGRHPDAVNRWHVMDLERSALVPLSNPGAPTLWDNHWGTCLNLDSATLNCDGDRSAAGLDVGVAAGTKTTALGEVDAQTIPLTVDTALGLPNGQYQVVTLTNPYGLLKEDGGAIGSVQCVTINLTIPTDSSQPGFLEPTITIADATPATCLLPTKLDPALTGPGGVDPMAGADSILPCIFYSVSHCWPNPPGTAPHDGDYIAAHSLATGNPAVTPNIQVTRGSQIPASIAATGLPTPPPAATPVTPSAPTMPAPSASTTHASASTRSAMTVATGHTRTALRRVFGTGLTALRVACRLRPADAATCTVRFRKRGARYSGHIYLRTLGASHAARRWQYRIDVTRRKSGRTTHVRRAYRTGGLA